MLHRAHFAHHILIVTLLTTATVIPSRPASAQDKQSKAEQAKSEKAARVHFQTAEKAFNLGKFDEALKSYEQAYEAKNLSGFLFNIAQCHRNLANPERALFFYQRYLALEPSSPNRALVEELIGIHSMEEMENLLEEIDPPFIILKPTLLGGFRQTDEWIKAAEYRGIEWWTTSALESNIGLNAICQFTSTYSIYMPQGLGTGGLYHNNIPSPLTVYSGGIHYDKDKDWDFSLLEK